MIRCIGYVSDSSSISWTAFFELALRLIRFLFYFYFPLNATQTFDSYLLHPLSRTQTNHPASFACESH